MKCFNHSFVAIVALCLKTSIAWEQALPPHYCSARIEDREFCIMINHV